MLKKILIIYICLLSSCVFASDKTVTIAISQHPPFEFQDGDKISGIDADLIREVLDQSGYKAEFILVPWLRAMMLVQTGQVDAIASIKKEGKQEQA